jgi:hypothetical protein
MILRALLTATAALTLLSGAAGAASPAPPQIWFAPLPRDTVVGRSLGFDGSKDFDALFDRNAAWPKAAASVSVFKLYGGWAANEATLPELRRIVADLDRRGIALAIEDGALHGTGCGQGVEGFVPADEATRLATRIAAAGGKLAYVALDSSFRFGVQYDGGNACHLTAETAAQQFAAFAADVHRVFPNAVVGDIESLPTMGADPAALVAWMDTYRRVTGSPLPFFHLDMGYHRLDWPEAARYLEDAARARGIPFGIIYDGDGNQTDGGNSDADWIASAEQRFVTFEAQYGGRPDQVVLQSWVDHPDAALPETQRNTFTWLIDRYVRPRTRLALTRSPGRVSGRLISSTGAPVANARIELAARPLTGSGIAGDYTLTGTVPRTAFTAVLWTRVGVDCGCTGAADFRLMGARYADGGTSTTIPVGGFTATGTATVATEGPQLHITAAAGQTLALNSTAVAATPGSRFAVAFTARVAPGARESGYFALSFRDATGFEISRRLIPLDTLAVTLGTPRTDANGRFTVRVGHLASTRVEAWFRGDASRFPAYASLG